jgi:GT2 family glycosyltransferase
MKKCFVSIIIANFNGERFLPICLNSVLRTSNNNFEVLLVDDGSTDRSLEIIRKFQKQDKRISFLRNEKNLGAAASRNKAVKKAKGEIIVFLDNDTEVTKNWLTELTESLLREKNIGAAQALLLDFEKRDLIQMAGGLLIPHVAWLVPFYQWQRYEDTKAKLKERDIVAISAALAVKRKVIDKIGVFDEKEAVYTEDLDFCWRIWIAGYRIVLAPQSIVYHWTKSVMDRATMKASYTKIYFHLAKNSFRSISKNYETLNAIKYLSVSLVINLGRGVVFIFTRGNLSAFLGAFRGLLWFMLNILDTINIRKRVQNTRLLSDNQISNRVFIQDNFFTIYKKYFFSTKDTFKI